MCQVLFREWLLAIINKGEIEGVQWLNRKNGTFTVNWIHKSLRFFKEEDFSLFKAWAIHTGRYNASQPDPKRWKGNFRSTLNVRTDIIQVKHNNIKNGYGAYKTFKFLAKNENQKCHTVKNGRKLQPQIIPTHQKCHTVKKGRKLQPQIIPTLTTPNPPVLDGEMLEAAEALVTMSRAGRHCMPYI